jgi:hypothetical protein
MLPLKSKGMAFMRSSFGSHVWLKAMQRAFADISFK